MRRLIKIVIAVSLLTVLIVITAALFHEDNYYAAHGGAVLSLELEGEYSVNGEE